MTSGPAGFLRLKDTGRIAEGFYADLAVFDPATRADHLDYPAPNQYPQGIKYVVVNGRVTAGGESPETAGELRA